jgi:hypothetical protein
MAGFTSQPQNTTADSSHSFSSRVLSYFDSTPFEENKTQPLACSTTSTRTPSPRFRRNVTVSFEKDYHHSSISSRVINEEEIQRNVSIRSKSFLYKSTKISSNTTKPQPSISRNPTSSPKTSPILSMKSLHSKSPTSSSLSPQSSPMDKNSILFEVVDQLSPTDFAFGRKNLNKSIIDEEEKGADVFGLQEMVSNSGFSFITEFVTLN